MKIVFRIYIYLIAVILSTVRLCSAQTISAYIDGNWNDASTWSSNSVPTSSSDVVISENKTISITSAVEANYVNITNGILSIETGSLTVNTFEGEANTSLQLYGDSYPTSSIDNFVGNTVLKGNSYTFTHTSVNNLFVNLNDDANVVTLSQNTTINGYLKIEKGTLNISKDLVVYGDITISEGAVLTGSGTITLHGSLKNEGSITGSTLAFTFAGTSDVEQVVTLDGVSQFGNIIVNRGAQNRRVGLVADKSSNFSSTKITLTSGTLVAGSNIYLDNFSIGDAIAEDAGLEVNNGKISIAESNAVVKGLLSVVNGTLTVDTITLNGGTFEISGGQADVTKLMCSSGSGKFSQISGTLNVENIELSSSDATYSAKDGVVNLLRALTLTCISDVIGTIVKCTYDGNFKTTIALWNLTVEKSINFQTDLIVQNSLDVEDGGSVNCGNYDIELQGNLNITSSGATNKGNITLYSSGTSNLTLYKEDSTTISGYKTKGDSSTYTTNGVSSNTIIFNNCEDSQNLLSGDYTAGYKDNSTDMVINKEPESYIKLSDVAVNFDNSLASNATDNKTLVMQSGEVIFDVDGQNVPITTGGEDFYVPEDAIVTANNGVTISATGCSSGVTLAGVLNANSGSKWNINGHIFYQGDKAVVNQQDAEFTIATQLTQSPSSSGSLELNILNEGSILSVGTNSCGDINSSVGIFSLTANSHIDMAKNSKIIIGKSLGDNSLADISMQMSYTNTNYAQGAVFQIGTDNNNISTTINSIAPTPSITINNASKLSCLTNYLTIYGDLTINNNAVFNQNGRNVNLYGNFDLVSGGSLNHNSSEADVFNFAGSNQIVTGSPSFYIAKLSNSATVNVTNDIVVENLLNIGEKNTLVSEDSNIKVLGTYQNDGVYSYNGTGVGKGIYLNGIDAQEIISSGVNGKITLDNAAGAFVKSTNNPLIIEKSLNLSVGVLSLDDNILKLNGNAVFEGNDFGVDKMVKFSESYLTNGVTKVFATGFSDEEFLFPLGTEGKYTPALLNISSVDDGAELTLCPHNKLYPAIIDDTDEDYLFDDTKNALLYYWTIKSFGMSSLIGDVTFTHADGDAFTDKDHGYTLEDNYICAKLLDREVDWNKYVDFSTGNIYSSENKTLTFKFDGFNDDQLSGAYTAGVCQNSKEDASLLDPKGIGAIPDRISSYVTYQTGEWHDADTWVLCDPATQKYKYDADGELIHEVPLDGASVFVRHAVTINNGDRANYLKISNLRTYIDSEDGNILMDDNKHYLGNVSGIGRITFTDNCVFAEGSYTDFVSADGGTFVFAGSSNYGVFGDLKEFNNVEFIGSG